MYKITLEIKEAGQVVSSCFDVTINEAQRQMIHAALKMNVKPEMVQPALLEIDWSGVPPELNFAKVDEEGKVWAFAVKDHRIDPTTMFRVIPQYVINSRFVDRTRVIRRPA